MNISLWCQVIDNYGDLGVCWRLTRQLAARGHQVFLRLSDASALSWMAPEIPRGVQVLPWQAAPQAQEYRATLLIEAFGCTVPAEFLELWATYARQSQRQYPSSPPLPQTQPAPAWINLEYLSAENFAVRAHGLPSPVLAGPAAGLTKRFFYPGFVPASGSLLRELDLQQRQAAFARGAWLQEHGVDPPKHPQQQSSRRLTVSLFCYEPAALKPMLAWLDSLGAQVLVTAGRAQAALRQALAAQPLTRLQIVELGFLSQDDYDHLLWACDLNFVRGEDSLVRALWAGKPFVWQIYPQHDQAHQAKLQAFLDWLEAPAPWRAVHAAWNAPAAAAYERAQTATLFTPPSTAELAHWAKSAQAARQRLLAQDDLLTQLLEMAEKHPA